MIKNIITAILAFLAFWFKKETKPTFGDGVTNESIKKAGAKRIKNPPKLPLTIFVALGIWFTGCNRTVYVPDGAAVRLRQDTKRVDVWIETETGWEAGSLIIPNGWYCMPLTDNEIRQAR